MGVWTEAFILAGNRSVLHSKGLSRSCKNFASFVSREHWKWDVGRRHGKEEHEAYGKFRFFGRKFLEAMGQIKGSEICS